MVLSKLVKRSFLGSVVIASVLITTPVFAQTAPAAGSGGSGGISEIETMVTDLDGIADDAFPIAVGVTGFAVAALLIKRVLYA